MLHKINISLKKKDLKLKRKKNQKWNLYKFQFILWSAEELIAYPI